MISLCLEKGWNSVLFDGSKLASTRTSAHPSRWSPRRGATARWSRARSRASSGSRRCRRRGAREKTLETAVDFIRSTGVDVFAPAIGNAHGMYRSTPKLDSQRVTDIVEATGIPVALHGGTGMTADQFGDLIGRGCAKVNISTALKIAYMQAGYDHITTNPTSTIRRRCSRLSAPRWWRWPSEHISLFGSEGKAW